MRFPSFLRRTAVTSVEAFADIQEKLPTLHDRIINHMSSGSYAPSTRSELVEALGIKGTTLTARIRELLDLGRIVEAGRRKCSVTGREVQTLELA